MFSLHARPGFFQFAQYFHFAEPFPPGVVVAYEDATHPEDELATAAEALRAAEVESVREDDAMKDTVDLGAADPAKSMRLTAADLESMSIDEVRMVASALDIPDRSKITEKAELIEEILRRA